MSCSICVCDLLEPPEGAATNDIAALECKHVFHSICIDRALAARGLCPVCRAIVFPERMIQLHLGMPLDLEELRMTQSTMTQSIRSETRFAVDALLKCYNGAAQQCKHEKEETDAYNEICDLLDEEHKENEADLQKYGQALSKIRKKADVLDEKRREFGRSPQDSLTLRYRDWLLNADTGKEERRLRAMDIAEKSKEERRRFLEYKHCKTSQVRVNIEETIRHHKEKERLAKEAEEKARLKHVHSEQRYHALLAQARELGVDEHAKVERKKRRAPIDTSRSSGFDLGSVVDVTFDEAPVQVEDEHDVFGYQHDLDMDVFGYDYGTAPTKTAKTEKAVPSSSVLEGGYISKVYSQHLDKAPKKQRDLLRLFN